MVIKSYVQKFKYEVTLEAYIYRKLKLPDIGRVRSGDDACKRGVTNMVHD